MPRAIPVPIRRAIVERRFAGQGLDTIARGLDLPYGTVRCLGRRYRRNGEADLIPDYHPGAAAGERPVRGGLPPADAPARGSALGGGVRARKREDGQRPRLALPL